MRRRRKKRDQNELFKALFGLIGVGGLYTYYFTQSLNLSAIVVFSLYMITLIITKIQKWNHIKRLKKSGIADIDKMSGEQFEHYLACLFKSQGYTVKVTRSVGDFGADLVLERQGNKIVIQAKRHGKNIGIEAVQQVYSSKNYYGASEAWVFFNRGYTKSAVNLAKANDVKLIGRNELIEMMLRMNPC